MKSENVGKITLKNHEVEKACLSLIGLRCSVFFNLSETNFKERDSMQPVYTSMHRKL